MPGDSLAQGLMLPELRLVKTLNPKHSGIIELVVEKTSDVEVCPKCAAPARAVYDRRWATVRDEPLRAKRVVLKIRKRRFSCRPCGKPFTEPVPGVRKGARCTERFRKSILWACDRFRCLTDVMRQYRCSSGFVYETYYAELERKRRERAPSWPTAVGIDEHYFKKGPGGFREFVSMIVDYHGSKLIEVVEGRRAVQLEIDLAHIPGRDNVRWVTIDLADPYKNFVRDFFPNARIVADKFHVLRLLHPAINRRRKQITGDRRSLKIRRLLLRNGKSLTPVERFHVWRWLASYPELREVYQLKERLHGFYRIKGYKRAKKALVKITDDIASSEVSEIQTLRKTLMRWREPILNYFRSNGLTNGKTEGFNTVAKMVKRCAFGFKKFRNYRLRLLNACG